MADRYLLEPDVGFIEEVSGLGGQDLKKCYQCATCSVVCPISPDTKPFPRKEMIAASWGLKEKLIGNPDIWLCHNCGDCSTKCPRGAQPGDVLAAVRAHAIGEYAAPKAIANAVNDPKKLPLLLGIPALLMIVVGFITGLLDFTPEGHGRIAHADFFSTWLVDLFMIPAALWVVAIFALGLKRFIGDIHANAVKEGKTDKTEIHPAEFIKSLVMVIPKILKHDKFNECTENTERSTQHMMVLFGFIGLFIVTAIFFVVLYGFQIHGPYSQLNPVKWLANISGIALVIGISLMIKSRMAKTDQVSTYKDWFLLWLIFTVAVSGMLAEMTRLAGMAATTYAIYFIHMVTVFSLFVYLPFTKLAHLVYRTVAMAYAEYSNRGF